MYILRKHSTPRWFRKFETLAGLTNELSLFTCLECKDSYGNNLISMLYSDCGLDFTIEGVDMNEPLSDAEFIQAESAARYVKYST